MAVVRAFYHRVLILSRYEDLLGRYSRRLLLAGPPVACRMNNRHYVVYKYSSDPDVNQLPFVVSGRTISPNQDTRCRAKEKTIPTIRHQTYRIH